jgi:hypothetical protein
MDQVRYFKEAKVAPLLNNMVRQLLIERPDSPTSTCTAASSASSAESTRNWSVGLPTVAGCGSQCYRYRRLYVQYQHAIF